MIVATADGFVHGVSLAEGRKIWSIAPEPPSGFFSNPLPLPDRPDLILLANQSGHLHALSATNQRIEWSIDFSQPDRINRSPTAFLTTPCIIQKNQLTIVVARTDGIIFTCNLYGNRIPQVIHQLPGETFSVPVGYVEDDLLSIFIGCRDDNIYSLEMKLQTV